MPKMPSKWVAAAGALAFAGVALAQTTQGADDNYPMPPPDPVIVTTPQGRDVPVRINPDRHTRCLQYGTSIGVPADRMDDYIKRCVLR